jgi:senataxin
MVIIDEASQAIELSALIPLKYQPKHTILVGDPQQLPPTVLSQEVSLCMLLSRRGLERFC